LVARAPRATPFPYTTLFRSKEHAQRQEQEKAASRRQALRRVVLRLLAHGRSASGFRALSDLLLMPAASSSASSRLRARWSSRTRSEEHTSELQSRENLVCRL